MSGEMDLKLEALSKYIVTSPSWIRSFVLILILCGCVEVMTMLGPGSGLMHPNLFPVAAYLIPALAALAFTPWLARRFSGKLDLGWSGLTAALGLIIALFISLSPSCSSGSRSRSSLPSHSRLSLRSVCSSSLQ